MDESQSTKEYKENYKFDTSNFRENFQGENERIQNIKSSQINMTSFKQGR